MVYQHRCVWYISHGDSCCNEIFLNDLIYKTITTELHEISGFSDCHLTNSYKIESSRAGLNKTPALPEVSLILNTDSASWLQRWEDGWRIRRIWDTDCSNLTMSAKHYIYFYSLGSAFQTFCKEKKSWLSYLL